MEELARDVEKATALLEAWRWGIATGGAGGPALGRAIGAVGAIGVAGELRSRLGEAAGDQATVARAAARLHVVSATWPVSERFVRLWREPVQGPRGAIPLARVATVLATEPIGEARWTLLHQRDRLLHRERGLLADRASISAEALAEFAGDGAAGAALLVGASVDDVQRGAEDVLGCSDDAWRELVTWTLRRVGLPPASANEADIAYALRGSELAAAFPGGGARLAAELTGEGCGMGARHLILDTTDPTRWPPAPIAALVAPPSDVRLAFVGMPPDGPGPWEASLRALGTAVAASAIHPDHAASHRVCLAASEAPAVGAALATLLLESTWIARHATAPSRDLMREVALAQLGAIRSAAARTLATLAVMRSGPTADAQEAATTAWQRALGATPSPWRWLADIDPLLEDVWRARVDDLAIARVEELRERFDEQWFRVPEAGAALLVPLRAGTPEEAPPRLAAVRRVLAALE